MSCVEAVGAGAWLSRKAAPPSSGAERAGPSGRERDVGDVGRLGEAATGLAEVLSVGDGGTRMMSAGRMSLLLSGSSGSLSEEAALHLRRRLRLVRSCAVLLLRLSEVADLPNGSCGLSSATGLPETWRKQALTRGTKMARDGDERSSMSESAPMLQRFVR